MIGTCPTIKLVGETSVSGSLQAMDCQIEQAVQIGYDRLFGSGGAFATVLTALLTIYVALLAYGFITGRTRLTLTMMSPRLMTMVLVLTFVTVWPAYHTIFYGLFVGGPDQIAAALLGQKGSAIMGFAESLDQLFVRFAHIANALESAGAQGAQQAAQTAQQAAQQAGGQPQQITAQGAAALMSSKSMPVSLFWLSGLILLTSTLGVLILSRLVLYLLLILGPLFIVMALFSQTRGLFNGWIRTTTIFALVPMLSVLGGSAALMLFVPLLEAIAANPLGAVVEVQPMVILFLGSIIYSAFIAAMMWVSASLVHDWQAALRDRAASGFRESQRDVLMATERAAAGGAGVAQAGYGSDLRIEALSQAVSRQTLPMGANYSGPDRPEGGGGTGRRERVQGLGQSFRGAKPAAGSGSSSLNSTTSSGGPAQ